MPVNLTARDFRALAQPLPDDAPKSKRRRRKRVYERCAVCEADILDSESGYHVQINGIWEHYHRECWYKGRP